MKGASFLVAIVAVVACRAAPREGVPPTEVVCTMAGPGIHPARPTLHAGDTLRVSVSFPLCPYAGTTSAFRWSTSDSSIALIGAASGLIQARKSGTVTIVAVEDHDPTVKLAALLVVAP